jgi:hypothetical protein
VFSDIEQFVSNPKAELKKMRLVLWHFERKSKKKKHVWHFLIFFWVFGSLDLFVCILCSIVPGTISAVLDPREEVSSNPYCGW